MEITRKPASAEYVPRDIAFVAEGLETPEGQRADKTFDANAGVFRAQTLPVVSTEIHAIRSRLPALRHRIEKLLPAEAPVRFELEYLESQAGFARKDADFLRNNFYYRQINRLLDGKTTLPEFPLTSARPCSELELSVSQLTARFVQFQQLVTDMEQTGRRGSNGFDP